MQTLRRRFSKDVDVNYKLLASLLILASLPLSAETYKWVNEEGVVTYSQSPPPGQTAERIKLRNTGQTTGPSSQDKLDRLRQRMADGAEDRQLKQQQRQEDEEAKKLKQQNCKSARSNLRKLQGLGNRLYKTDGEYRRLGEEERQDLMQKEREHIKKNCGS
jgi:hypothetical protein